MLSFIFEMADMTVLPTDVENCSSLDSQQTLVFHSLSICHMPGISLSGGGGYRSEPLATSVPGHSLLGGKLVNSYNYRSYLFYVDLNHRA